MEMKLRAPVTSGYFLLGALRLVNAASPRNIDQKKISSGTQGIPDLALADHAIYRARVLKIQNSGKCDLLLLPQRVSLKRTSEAAL